MIGIIVGAVVLAIVVALGFAIYKSLTYIGPTEVGLPIGSARGSIPATSSPSRAKRAIRRTC
jgi:RsiW-degrading membrane proteinase PrsW (M82 family)